MSKKKIFQHRELKILEELKTPQPIPRHFKRTYRRIGKSKRLATIPTTNKVNRTIFAKTYLYFDCECGEKHHKHFCPKCGLESIEWKKHHWFPNKQM